MNIDAGAVLDREKQDRKRPRGVGVVLARARDGLIRVVAQPPLGALCCAEGPPPQVFEGEAPPPMRSLLAAALARWKRLSPLTRDVTFVLVLKATALGILWSLFFSAPIARHMSLVPDRVADRLMSPSPALERADVLR